MKIDEKDIIIEMHSIGVDESGIKYMDDKFRFRVLKFKDIESRYANMIKQDMLSIGGEVAVNKGCIDCSVEKSDILIAGTIKQLKKLATKLLAQPAVCKEIAEQISGYIKNEN